jgi:hypothetical protein
MQFVSLCGECGVTVIALHWYNDHNLFSDSQNWVDSACSFGLEVWITEVSRNRCSTKPLLAIINVRHMIPSKSGAGFFRKLFHDSTKMLAPIAMRTLKLRILTKFCWKMEARPFLQSEYNTLSLRTRWNRLYARLWSDSKCSYIVWELFFW